MCSNNIWAGTKDNFRKKFADKMPVEAMDWLETNGEDLLNDDVEDLFE